MSFKSIRLLAVSVVGLALLLFTVTIGRAAFSASLAPADVATATETMTATATGTLTETATSTVTETAAPTQTQTAVPTQTGTVAPTATGTLVATMTETPVPSGTPVVPVTLPLCGREEYRESASAQLHEHEDINHPCVTVTPVSTVTPNPGQPDDLLTRILNFFMPKHNNGNPGKGHNKGGHKGGGN